VFESSVQVTKTSLLRKLERDLKVMLHQLNSDIRDAGNNEKRRPNNSRQSLDSREDAIRRRDNIARSLLDLRKIISKREKNAKLATLRWLLWMPVCMPLNLGRAGKAVILISKVQ